MNDGLRRAAWVAACLNGLGLVCAVTGMRPGAPDEPLEARVEWVAARPFGWTVGWGVWMLAALAVVVLFAHLARAVRGRKGVLALVLVASGAAVDLTCDALQMTLLPDAAASDDRQAFERLERTLWIGGVVVACGLYAVGTAVATVGLGERASRVVQAAAAVTVGGCAVWIVAELALARALLAPATGVSVGAFMVWAVGLATSRESVAAWDDRHRA